MSDRNDQADERFVDALLERVYRKGDDGERRVDDVLERLEREHWSEATEVRRRGRWPLRLGAVVSAAAALVLVSTAVLWTGSSARAMGVIERSLATMSELVDRQYSFVVETERSGETVRSSGDMYVRGTGEMAIRAERGGGDLWVGEDANESWIVPVQPLLPVLTGPKGAIREIVVPGDDASLPLLRLTSALQRFGEAYDLRLARSGGGVQVVTGELRPSAGREAWPSSVLVEAQDDGLVTELELRWSRFRGGGARTVRLRFLGGVETPTSFYGHRAHHAGRRVIDGR